MAQQDPVAKDHDFEIYKSLREFEQHFNQTQVEVKKLASAWMLATFAANWPDAACWTMGRCWS